MVKFYISRYKLFFQNETNEEIEKRKKQARKPIIRYTKVAPGIIPAHFGNIHIERVLFLWPLFNFMYSMSWNLLLKTSTNQEQVILVW